MEGFNVGIAGTEGFQVLCKLFWNDSTILVATTLPLPNCTSEKKKILTTKHRPWGPPDPPAHVGDKKNKQSTVASAVLTVNLLP